MVSGLTQHWRDKWEQIKTETSPKIIGSVYSDSIGSIWNSKQMTEKCCQNLQNTSNVPKLNPNKAPEPWLTSGQAQHES